MDENNRYRDEFGAPLPRYWPKEPDRRGRHASFASAVTAAFADLTTVHEPFFDSLADRWPNLFPNLPARPGRYDDGKIFLYVANAPTLYLMRPKLAAVRRTLAALPDAPKKIDLRLEIRSW